MRECRVWGHRSEAGFRCSPAIPILASLLVAPLLPASDSVESRFEVAPGDLFMSEAEKAIVAAPGLEDVGAVILLESSETHDVIEPGGKAVIPLPFVWLVRTSFPFAKGSIIAHHRRVKVLSNAGRDVANVEIPFIEGRDTLDRFWARTILPDGGVLELTKEDLQEQTLVRHDESTLKVLKAALPGVVPGAVIDFGWFVQRDGVSRLRRIPVQLPFPVMEYRYRWVTPLSGASVHRRGTEGLSVEMKRSAQGFAITGRDLPPMTREPFMPPASEVDASLTLYYHASRGAGGSFWNAVAMGLREEMDAFLGSQRSVRKAVESIGAPREGDLHERLEAAYDWIETHVRNTDLPGPGSRQEDAREGPPDTLREAIERGRGNTFQLACFFLAAARELGARATLVMLPDRRESYFHRQILDPAQLDGPLVAIGATKGHKERFVAPGWGLPYGEIPWWYSGVEGLRVTEKGAGSATTHHAPAERTASETVAEISFPEPGGAARARWTRTGTAQYGYSARVQMRGQSPQERQEHMALLCGGGGPAEILRAKAPAVEEIRSPFRIECDITLTPPTLSGEPGVHIFSLEGPWFPPIQDLPSSTRVHRIVFDYARAHHTSMVVSAPFGFGPSEPPPPVKVESPFGTYALDVSATDGGYRVERRFVLSEVEISALDYPALRDFFSRALRADRTVLTFARGRP